MQLALILYIRHIQFISVQYPEHLRCSESLLLVVIPDPSQSIYFLSHHHLLILQISIVYKLYVTHGHLYNLLYVLDESLNSKSVLRESSSD